MDHSRGRMINGLDEEDQVRMKVLAKDLFIHINEYLQLQRNSDSEPPSQRLAVTTIPEPNEVDNVSHVTKELIEQHNLISGYVRRCNGDQWHVEDTWASVDILRLDEIRQVGEYEWQPLNYNDDPEVVKNAMVQDENIVLLRNIMDWSRSYGDVLSQQIVWSGSFGNCQRILEMLEENSNTSNLLVTVVRESFHLHPDLREQHIIGHSTYPLAAAIAAIETSENIYLSEELAGTDDDERDSLLCSICHEVFSTLEPVTVLRCNHRFHRRCIFHWFVRRLSCPLCRDELLSPSFPS